MNPENRTRSSLGPLPRSSAWLTGGTIASMVLMLAGIASPAIAASPSSVAPASVSVAAKGGDGCQVSAESGKAVVNGNGNGNGGCGGQGPQGPGGPQGPIGATGPVGPCNDLDHYNPLVVAPVATHQVAAALIDPDGAAGPLQAAAFAGIRTVPGGVFDWENISNTPGGGFPAGACSISVSSNGVLNSASVQVLTTAGTVFETTCTLTFATVGPPPTAPSLSCTEVWTPQVTPSA